MLGNGLVLYVSRNSNQLTSKYLQNTLATKLNGASAPIGRKRILSRLLKFFKGNGDNR